MAKTIFEEMGGKYERHNYSMFFDKYEQAPKSVQDKVIASRAK